jgi:hypothetical protein
MIMNWKQLQNKEDTLLELNTLTEDITLAQEEDNFDEQERLAKEITILLEYINKQEWTYTIEELGL